MSIRRFSRQPSFGDNSGKNRFDAPSVTLRPDEVPNAAARRRRLEPIQAKGVLCGGVSEDYVRVVEHVEAVQRQRVEFQVVQWELGVDVEADVCGQGAREVLE